MGTPEELARAFAPTPIAGTDESLKTTVQRATATAERAAIVRALQAARGNQTVAARALKIDYKTLYRKMKQHALSSQEFSPRV